jgi:hypothetical protein
MEIEVSFKDYIPNLYSMYRLIGLIKNSNYKKGKFPQTVQKENQSIQTEIEAHKREKLIDKIDKFGYFL